MTFNVNSLCCRQCYAYYDETAEARITRCSPPVKETSVYLRDPAVDSEQFRRDLKTYICLLDIRRVSALEVFT